MFLLLQRPFQELKSVNVIISNNEDIQCVQKISTIQKIYIVSIIFHKKSLRFKKFMYFPLFFTKNHYRSSFFNFNFLM